MRAQAGTVGVQRNVLVRLFSGFWLQPFFTMALLLSAGLTVLVSTFSSVGGTLADSAGAVPLLVLWSFSLAAYARVDGQGVRWRCFRVHDQPWAQIERIRLGALFVKGSMSQRRPVIMVTFGGREIAVMPTYGCSRRRLYAFTEAVCAQAIAHGKPVYVDSPQWQGVPMREGMQPGPPPGPRLETSPVPRSLQVRLFVLVLPVIGVLGLIGGITGWDTNGLGDRIAVGIVGGVLLLVGVPLALLLFLGAKRSGSPVRLVGRTRMR